VATETIIIGINQRKPGKGFSPIEQCSNKSSKHLEQRLSITKKLFLIFWFTAKDIEKQHVLTEALLAYRGSQSYIDTDELSIKIDQISKMLQQNSAPSIYKESNVQLSDNFIASIRKTAKPSVSIE
jgi:hypothetical protein